MTPKYRLLLLILTLLETFFLFEYFSLLGQAKSTAYPGLAASTFATIILTAPMWVTVFTPDRYPVVLRALQAFAIAELLFPFIGMTLVLLTDHTGHGLHPHQTAVVAHDMLKAMDIFCLVAIVVLARMKIAPIESRTR